MTINHKPKILMFDSGVGGLSVMQEVYKSNSQALFYYLFDHECFPYSNKSEVFLKKRVGTLLESIGKRLNPDLIVIACNTASTIVLPTLRDIFSIPIVGVVPAIKPAAKLSNNKRICLLATKGTVNRSYTDFLINEFASDCKVLKIGSEDLVRLAEEQLIRNSQPLTENIDSASFVQSKHERLKKILEPILMLDDESKPDVVVLGCTHFPLVKEDIAKVLGPKIKLIDSGEAIARRVSSLLNGGACDNCLTSSFASNPMQDEALCNCDREPTGPIEAFYTGHCEDPEKQSLEATFEHFGFHKVSSFNL